MSSSPNSPPARAAAGGSGVVGRLGRFLGASLVWLTFGLWSLACDSPNGSILSGVSTSDPTTEKQTQSEVARFSAAYIEQYFEFFPSRATAAGRHDRDSELEDFSLDRLSEWIAKNHEALRRAEELAKTVQSAEDQLDLVMLDREIRLELFDLEVLHRPDRDPLWWSGVFGEAHVYLLLRDDGPLEQRLRSVAARAGGIPRLARQAADRLRATEPAEMSAEITGIASRQVRAVATFYRDGLAGAAAGDIRLSDLLTKSGALAAGALVELADELDRLAGRASGSPRLGESYRERFRLVTGDQRDPLQIAREARVALAEKRREAASYARSVWPEVLPGIEPPSAERDLLATFFRRVEADRARSVEDFVNQYRGLLSAAEAFARQHEIVSLPDPLTVYVGTSPDYFVGQSVGGVYPAGSYAPESDTLFLLPTPPSTATAEERDRLFRDFNNHFNVMITPHEMIPGHYLQLKWAGRHARRVRAIFPDGVYVEGWGTFCERLMLDLGWGDALAYGAHLKKQIENITRTIVDIEVNMGNASREEVLRFVRDEGLQAEQFANNMWTRAITSSPQLVSYWLGYERVRGLFDDVRAERGDRFVLKEFMDGMMELGPVPVRYYRDRMLAEH